MNAYNIYSEKEPSTILFHAIAESEDQVKELAKEAGLNITGLTIDLERTNIKHMSGKSFGPSIKDAVIK